VPGFSQSDAVETTTATLHLYSKADNISPPVNFTLLVNGEKITDAKITSVATPITLQVPSKLLRDTANKLTIQTDVPAKSELAPIYIDSLDVEYASLFAGKNGSLEVELPEDETVANSRLQLTGFRAQHLIALKLDGDSAERLNVQGGRGTALVGSETGPGSHFLFQEEELIQRPPLAEDLNEDPISPDGDADVLVIYHHTFQDAADLLTHDLQEAHIRATRIDVQRIYNAYSDGDLSTNAVRDYLASAVYTWKGRRPYAAILIGDANGDGHNISRQNIPNFIPIHSLSTASPSQTNRISADSYYSWMNSGDEATDLIISRISAGESQEALNTVKNIIAYRADEETPADWKQRVMYISDTGGFIDSVRNLTQSYSRSISDQKVLAVDDLPWEDNYYLPPGLISRDEDSKVSPAMTAAISDVYTSGCALSLFFGHGAPNLWSNQRFWFGGGTPNSDILRLEVNHRLPFVASFTCNNAVIDYPLRPWNVCIAEDFMRYEGKGAIGCFMPSGPGYVTNHEVLADGFLRGWTLGIREHGILSELSRINHQVRMEIDNHSRMFIELGDPTLKLPELRKPQDDGDDTKSFLIQRIVPVDEPTSASLTGSWSVSILNRSRASHKETLSIDVLDEDGKAIKSQRTKIEVAPLAEKNIIVTAQFPKPGYYRIHADFPSSSGQNFPADLSSRVTDYEFSIPSEAGSLQVLKNTVSIREANAPGTNARLAYVVANNGSLPAYGELDIHGTIDEEKVFALKRTTDILLPGRVASLTEGLPIPTLLQKPLTVRFDWIQRNDQKQEISHGKESITIDPTQVAELRIIPDSLKIDPPQPFEGGTVFVNGEVENIGKTCSAPATMGLYAATDTKLSTPLRNLASASLYTLAALKPGEKRVFTLRWDPKDDAGEQQIVAVVDTGFLNIETQRDNNRATALFHVRTKTKLASGTMIVENTADLTYVKLIAQVSNLGETDSRPISVTFYNSQTQSDDTKLGEVIVQSVAAGQTQEVPMEVSLASFSSDPSKFQPSFTIALKGSLMRVSSVTQ
ncbi:MAG: C25 family cysteine peptidase, partial [Candidatus Sumerlaeota bacterium]